MERAILERLYDSRASDQAKYDFLKESFLVDVIYLIGSYDALEREEWDKIFSIGEDFISVEDMRWLYARLEKRGFA